MNQRACSSVRTDACGIAPRYRDAFGAVRQLSSQTQLAIREAMGVRERASYRGRRAVAVAKPSHSGSSGSIAIANSLAHRIRASSISENDRRVRVDPFVAV